MAMLKRVVDGEGRPLGWKHHCPGCGGPHVIRVDQPERNGHRWSFNGDQDRPTFAPSINARWGHYASGESAEACGACRSAREHGRKSPCGVCHYFVQAGRIMFCTDSTHALAGQTVDLSPIPT